MITYAYGIWTVPEQTMHIICSNIVWEEDDGKTDERRVNTSRWVRSADHNLRHKYKNLSAAGYIASGRDVFLPLVPILRLSHSVRSSQSWTHSLLRTLNLSDSESISKAGAVRQVGIQTKHCRAAASAAAAAAAALLLLTNARK